MMYYPENKRSTIAYFILIGLILVLTVVVFSFLFLRELFDSPSGPEDTTGEGTGTSSSLSSEEYAVQIAEHRALKQQYETALASVYLLLVNEDTPLPEDYSCDTVSLNQNPSQRLEVFAAAKLQQFLSEAAKAGYHPEVSAAYRSEEEQQAVFAQAVQSYMNAGYLLEQATVLVTQEIGSVAGSEHRTGLAVDISDPSQPGFASYAETALVPFGFVLRYPEGKESVTGRQASAVHFRYVGTEAALVMTEKNLTLEEYRDYLATQIEYQQQCMEALERAR